MASPFEIATKIAIKEMVENHSSKSKFGVFMTEENINTLVAELFQLVLTSRSLRQMVIGSSRECLHLQMSKLTSSRLNLGIACAKYFE